MKTFTANPSVMAEVAACVPGRNLLETAAQLLQEQTIRVGDMPEQVRFEDYMWFVDHAPQYIYADTDYYVTYGDE